jgi:hypothetical protein
LFHAQRISRAEQVQRRNPAIDGEAKAAGLRLYIKKEQATSTFTVKVVKPRYGK